MKTRGFTKKLFFLTIAAFFALMTSANAQTVLVNYDFGTTNGCTATPTSTATNITATFAVATGSCTSAGGSTAASPPAFVANTTAGQAPNISSSFTPAAQFTLGGSALNTYSSYSLFFQLRSSGTGPNTATVEYSVNGGAFVNAATLTVPTTGAFTNFNVDLTTISALNNATSIVFRITGSGGSASSGTFRVDNFQVQAVAPTAAQAEISGRVLAGRRAVSKVSVMLSGGDLEEPIYATTDFNGNYRFENLTVGQTYLLQVMTRRYRFNNPNIVVSLMDNIADANFIASGK